MTTQTASSLAEFYADPSSPYAAFPQEHRSGGSMPVTMLRVGQDSHSNVDPAVSEVLLVVAVNSNATFSWDLGDGFTEVEALRGGHMTIVPPNTEVRYNLRGPHDVIALSMSTGPLRAVLEDHGTVTLSAFDSLSAAGLLREEAIRQTMMHMWAESAQSRGASDLLMDGLMQVLLARLLDKAGALRRPQSTPQIGQVDISRIDALLDERLAERITVEDLARALDMPRWTFANAFKVATGETPHAYVTAKRIDKACHLLRLGDMPLAEIAYATGFASQSHMTDTFRRVIGTTPGSWRREMRG